jgi:hypothetical protein
MTIKSLNMTVKVFYVPLGTLFMTVKVFYVPLGTLFMTVKVFYVPLGTFFMTVKVFYVPLGTLSMTVNFLNMTVNGFFLVHLLRPVVFLIVRLPSSPVSLRAPSWLVASAEMGQD